jgi:hypothetical protein
MVSPCNIIDIDTSEVTDSPIEFQITVVHAGISNVISALYITITETE